MPELPEVQTTVNGINEHIKGKPEILAVWSGYGVARKSFQKTSATNKAGAKTRVRAGAGSRAKIHPNSMQGIKNHDYFKRVFTPAVLGGKIEGASRRGKNVLIHLNNGNTIIIHMKMTGHILYGKYEFKDGKNTKNSKSDKKNKTNKIGEWVPAENNSAKSKSLKKSTPTSPSTFVSPLHDPFNRHIRLVFTLSNGKHLVLCDTRKFAKVDVIETKNLHASHHLVAIGPEPLDPTFTFEKFAERLGTKPNWKIKQALLDQEVLAGVGNIYSDESLWRASIHPTTLVRHVAKNIQKMEALYIAVKQVLSAGIDFGGDSMSDYRNILGEKGGFQEKHNAYRKAGKPCTFPGCGGTIKRIVVVGRGTHFCEEHQK